jgi:hypothetical protein
MLAQNFKTPADLGITDKQFDALTKVLGMLEREELRHAPKPDFDGCNFNGSKFTGRFNMGAWRHDDGCGTVCCIGGSAELVGDVRFHSATPALNKLFYPTNRELSKILPHEAAIALRNYLTHGEPRWSEALAA